MPGLGYLLKYFVLERYYLQELFFEEAHFQCLHLTLTFRTTKNLCPNLQKPQPSKIPGYAPGQVEKKQQKSNLWFTTCKNRLSVYVDEELLESFMTEVPIVQKPVH